MIELPEAATLARQMNDTLKGKTITRFARGSQTHKFLWLNRPDEEYQSILAGRTITGASSFGRSIYLQMGREAMLWWSDAGGKILYLAPGTALPAKYHLGWDFSDGSHLIYQLEMWGAVSLLTADGFDERPHKESGTDPLGPEFTFEKFDTMLEEYPGKTSNGVKGFLVATGYKVQNHINGLGNAIVQDILFRAGIDPRRKIPTMNEDERRDLHEAIRQVLEQAVRAGGRDEELNLFGQPGGYARMMGSRTAGQPCPNCRTPILKIAYMGGACYLCPKCQK